MSGFKMKIKSLAYDIIMAFRIDEVVILSNCVFLMIMIVVLDHVGMLKSEILKVSYLYGSVCILLPSIAHGLELAALWKKYHSNKKRDIQT